MRIANTLVPGITIFHNFNFLSFGPEPILNSPWSEITKKFIENDKNLNNFPVRGKKFFQTGPQGIREATYSLIPIFVNPLNVSDFKNSLIDSISKKYKIEPKYLAFPVKDNNEKLKSPQKDKTQELNIAFAGSPNIENRSHKILTSLNSIQNDFKITWLINKNEKAKAQELLEEFNIKNYNLVLDRSTDKWQEVLSTADFAIHTQFSVFAQNYPYLQLSMMLGVPVIVSDFGYADSLPNDLVFKLPVGESESLVLKELLLNLKTKDLTELKNKTKSFAEENFSAQVVASELKEIIIYNKEKIAVFYQDWQAFTGLAKTALIQELKEDFDAELISMNNKQFSWQNILEKEYKDLGWLS